MTSPVLPRLLEPEALTTLTDRTAMLVWDLGSAANYQAGHVPGAVHIPPAAIIDGRPPVPGKLPEQARLEGLFSTLGLRPERHVVVYDDEGGGWAGRMIWTLNLVGHRNWSYLNGGIHAWRKLDLPQQNEANPPPSDGDSLEFDYSARACTEDILSALHREDFAPWDARSAEEYDGSSVRAARGGHIPGAVHCEWTTLMDPRRQLRLRPLTEIRSTLKDLGLTPERDIVTYCQTHHRSGLTWLVGRLLDYPRIRAYDGSWSEWGNRSDTPIESRSSV